MSKLAINKIRSDFPIFADKSLVYLDSAATTQKPQQVINSISDFYSTSYANVHRGIYDLSIKATEAYHSARLKVANFINTSDWRSIVFTSGTTESINLVAYSWARKNLKNGDEILITEMEHHSNIVPWQLVAEETGVKLKYIPINTDGTLDQSNIDELITNKTKLVSVIHQSNVFGTINPIKEIINHAKKVNAITFIDAAQSIPHSPIDVQDLDCDFLAFSGHKMLGPTGIGVLYGKTELLDSMTPFMGGGDMINSVTMTESTWNDIPYKFEAGTPKIAQAIGLGAAIDYINEIGLTNIQDYVKHLLNIALEKLRTIDGLTIYGHQVGESSSVVSFNLEGVHPHDLSQFLDQDGIAVRAGHHCAQPIMDKLGVSSTIRASFYLYNTEEEIDKLCASLKKTQSFFNKL
ncbi:MAG: cysteine desulfurase [Candidatus Marinimicrobia bacterium]|nr:cysteine desulfurase [Candidatus Neomarinimicrobiota bacterium]